MSKKSFMLGFIAGVTSGGNSEVEHPVLAPNKTWYKGTDYRQSITEIELVDTYTPTGNETESWVADEKGTGDIMCYVNGTKLTIAGNGSGKIIANKDSWSCFSGFVSCASINGLGLLDTSNVTNMSWMFGTCIVLTFLDLTSFDTSNATIMRYMFCDNAELKAVLVSDKWVIREDCDVTYMFLKCGTQYVTYV